MTCYYLSDGDRGPHCGLAGFVISHEFTRSPQPANPSLWREFYHLRSGLFFTYPVVRGSIGHVAVVVKPPSTAIN